MDMVNLCKALVDRLEVATEIAEGNASEDAKRGEIVLADRFSRGYALGYVHALQAAYDLLPDWVHDQGADL